MDKEKMVKAYAVVYRETDQYHKKDEIHKGAFGELAIRDTEEKANNYRYGWMGDSDKPTFRSEKPVFRVVEVEITIKGEK